MLRLMKQQHVCRMCDVSNLLSIVELQTVPFSTTKHPSDTALLSTALYTLLTPALFALSPAYLSYASHLRQISQMLHYWHHGKEYLLLTSLSLFWQKAAGHLSNSLTV